MSTPILPNVAPLDALVVDPLSIAKNWLTKFTNTLRVSGCADLGGVFAVSCTPWYKDHLALTWALRTVTGVSDISKLLSRAIEHRHSKDFTLVSASLVTMSPKLSFIQAYFTFSTDIARCSAVAKLIPESDRDWACWVLFTKMDELIGHASNPSHLDMLDETDPLELGEVEVLIIGAGQAGLQVAANLRTLDISNLIVERGARIGDHWRARYDSLRLHLSKWYSQLSYRPWPEEFPYYATCHEIADFLQWYAQSTHLNVLCSSQVLCANFDPDNQTWSVELLTGSGKCSIVAGQIVFATGVNGTIPLVPDIPGQTSFRGTAFHSSCYRNALGWEGKRALVLGTASSGHDIAHDLYIGGADVTMIQRSPTMVLLLEDVQTRYGRVFFEAGPPIDVSDVIWESTPIPIGRMLSAIAASHPSEAVRHHEEGLTKAGFKVAFPDPMGAVYNRGGGHYIDVGASALIIESKIHIKSGVPITRFTNEGLAFEDGNVLPADLVVFATGYNVHSMADTARQIVGPTIGGKLRDVWGLDDEGHLKGMHRNSGHPRLWYAGGDLGMSRYYAKILSLQIVATRSNTIQGRLEP